MDLYGFPENDYRYYLCHHGIKGQKWGVRRYQDKNGSLTAAGHDRYKYVSKNINDLSSYMKTNIKYSEFTKLKSAEEVERTGSGSCHDQVMYEMKKLRELGYKPKAQFVIEYDPKSGQGGTTHSFVHFKNGNQTIWFENAWGGEEGVHKYSSLKEIKEVIRRKHKDGQFGDNNKFTKLEFSDFKPDKQKPGSSLQEVVDVALSKEPTLAGDIAKGALSGAKDGVVGAAAKTVLGKSVDPVSSVAEGALAGAMKGAIDHTKKRVKA